MRIWQIFVVGVLCSTGIAGSIDLPEWDKEVDDSPWYPGGGLWPGGTLPKGAIAYIEKLSEKKIKPVPTKYVVLKEDAEGLPSLDEPELADDLPPLDEKLVEQYFGKKPEFFVVDPQHLITEQKANDVLRFLEIHAEESRFPIYPFVFGQNQDIPESIDVASLHKEWFDGAPVVWLNYKNSDPESLQILYSEAVNERIPKAALDKIREYCVAAAIGADNGPDQLEKIVIELSIQTFWLEKILDRPPLDPGPGIELTALSGPVQQREVREIEPAAPVEVEAELEPIPVVVSHEPEIPPIETVVSPKLVRGLLIGSSTVLFIALLLFLKTLLANRRQRRQAPVLFPVHHPRPRLGGEYSGGAFTGLSYEAGRMDARVD